MSREIKWSWGKYLESKDFQHTNQGVPKGGGGMKFKQKAAIWSEIDGREVPHTAHSQLEIWDNEYV